MTYPRAALFNSTQLVKHCISTMSVNYSKLHPVDMPVTDLDDGDDDMIMNSNVQPTHEQGFDPLEGFDYENDVRNGRVRPSGTAAAVSAAASSAAGGIGGFFSSIRNSVGGAYSNANGVEDDVSGVEWWASKIRNAGRSLRTNSYELQNRNASTGEFSFSDDDDLTLNNYGSGANKNKLRKFIWPGISLVLLIVCAVLIGTNNPFHAESSTTSVSGESSSEKIFFLILLINSIPLQLLYLWMASIRITLTPS